MAVSQIGTIFVLRTATIHTKITAIHTSRKKKDTSSNCLVRHSPLSLQNGPQIATLLSAALFFRQFLRPFPISLWGLAAEAVEGNIYLQRFLTKKTKKAAG